MQTRSHGRRITALLLTGMLGMLFSANAVAQQDPKPTLLLRPHCELEDQLACPNFDVKDPMTLVTPLLQPGQTLDMDLVLFNPHRDAIRGMRIWLSYDSEQLEGKTIAAAPAFPVAVPGEVEFSPQSGYAKVAASALDAKEPTDIVLPLARISFTVKAGAQKAFSPIGFHDLLPGTDGHTSVTTLSAPGQNLIAPPLGSLLVSIAVPPPIAQASSSAAASSQAPPAPAPAPVLPAPSSSAAPTSSSSIASSQAAVSSAASVSSIRMSSQSSVSSKAAAATASTASTASVAPVNFELLQVQSIQVGTKDNSLYATWDPLSHPKLQGYNVYYGTSRGEYLQRRSVSVAVRGIAVRDLQIGTTYYITVTAVDDQNRESSFGAEASVEIGNPATSSSPIVGDIDMIGASSPDDVAPGNPLEHPSVPLVKGIPGDSGSPSAILLLFLGSAIIGTLFAVRRQVIAARTLTP